jgi:hypothetical protein
MLLTEARELVKFERLDVHPTRPDFASIMGKAWTTAGKALCGEWFFSREELAMSNLDRETRFRDAENAILLGMLEQCRVAGVKLCKMPVEAVKA